MKPKCFSQSECEKVEYFLCHFTKELPGLYNWPIGPAFISLLMVSYVLTAFLLYAFAKHRVLRSHPGYIVIAVMVFN